MSTYIIQNYQTAKILGSTSSLTEARKKVYKLVDKHKRSRFAVAKVEGINSYGLGFAEYEELEDGKKGILFQSYGKNGAYKGAYILYKNGTMKMY